MGHVDWERVRRNALAFASNQLTEQPTPAGNVLRQFFTDGTTGIAADPLVRTWLPQRPASASWRSPLPSLPDGFWPYEFQAQAFDRLSVAGQLPRPTAIAAPEGSGKSECFLLPILDHCARQHGMNRGGIKAVIIYSSRAAAADNAARLGTMCRMFERFAALRPALLIDDFGANESVGDGFIINSLAAMAAEPPDVLLTVPEMLNLTLQSKRHAQVWSGTTPVSLRFIVLDDLHFYTDSGVRDLALLLRRLGARLGMASPSQPLGGAVPVVTAGVSVAPIEPSSDEGASSGAAPTVPDQPPATTPEPRSVLPRPKVDFRSGGGGLPELSTISADNPTAGLAGGLDSRKQAAASGLPPLGGATGTADTGDKTREPHPLLDLAEFLFGVTFSADSLIVASTMSPDELCPHPNPGLPTPSLAELARVPLNDPPAIFTRLFGDSAPIPPDRVALGEMLCSHPLVARLFAATHDRPMPVGELVAALGMAADPGVTQGAAAVQRLASLVGVAQRLIGSRPEPLARVDAQLSLTGMGRVMRSVSNQVEFAEPDAVDPLDPVLYLPPAVAAPDGDVDAEATVFLPAVACRDCGAAGWLATILGHEHPKLAAPAPLWAPFGDQIGNLGIVMSTEPVAGRAGSDPVSSLDPATLRLHVPQDDAVPQAPADPALAARLLPVRVTSGSAAVSARTCPVCGHQGTVDFVGATPRDLLAEVTTDLVRSADATGGQRLVVLTGSRATVDEQVTSLARSSFLNTLRARALQVLATLGGAEGAPSCTVPQLAAAVLAATVGEEQRRELAPTDLLQDPVLVSLWGPTPSESDLGVFARRIEFELAREFGHRSADADSLVGSGWATVTVRPTQLDAAITAVAAAVASEASLSVSETQIRAYIDGLLERLRLDGAIDSPLLRQFVTEGGDPAFVTERRPVGLPELLGPERPRFLTTAVQGGFESISSIHQRPGGARTWLVEWACSALGINAADVPPVTRAALESLARDGGPLFALDSMDGHRVYGLTATAVQIAASGAAPEEPTSEGTTVPSIRTASTVDVAPIVKAQTEWSFKHLPPSEAPNVLYMSAGHIRSDRNVIDTTIDLATVDSLVVEAAALGQMESVPEVRRVGIGSGSGMVVLIAGEHLVDGATSTPSKSADRSLVETASELPDVPPQISATRSDYVEFLFDRLAQGAIEFSPEFETLGQMMDVANSVPERSAPTPAAPTGGAVPGQPAQQQGSWTQGAKPPPGLPAMPDLDFKSSTLTPAATKPLFQTLELASAAKSSLTKATPLAEFRRMVVPLVSSSPPAKGKTSTPDEEADDLAQFAKSGLQDVLQGWYQTFVALQAAGQDVPGPGTMRISPAELGDMPWPDGVAILQQLRSNEAGRESGGSSDDKDTAPPEKTATPTKVWSAADDRLVVSSTDDEPLRIRLPILGPQAAVRTASCAAALALELPPGARVWTELVSQPDSSVPVGHVLIDLTATAEGQADDAQTARGEGSGLLAQPAGLHDLVAGVVDRLQECRCGAQGRAACGSCLLAALGPQAATSHGRLVDSDTATVGDGVPMRQLSRALALETLGPLVRNWGSAVELEQVPARVADGVMADELRRAFELSLAVWLDRAADAQGALSVTAEGLDFSIVFDGAEQSYRLTRSTAPAATSTPLYRLSPSDGVWPQIALMLVPIGGPEPQGDERRVLLDALQTLATVTDDQPDALAWVLTWADLTEFYDAVVAAEAADMADHSLVIGSARADAAAAVATAGGRVSVDALEQNRYLLLLDLLARPWRPDWATAAVALRSAAGAQAQDSDLPWLIVNGLAGQQ